MTSGSVWLLVWAGLLVVVTGLLTAADAALSGFSPARAGELATQRRPGAQRLVRLLADPRPYLNTLLMLRLAGEIAAIVLVAQSVQDYWEGRFWPAALTTIAVMLVISFVVLGVAPRTLGRQHDRTVALAAAGPITFVTTILGPVPKLLILIGNAITPGKGFREGPFSSEVELRELVDMAEESSLIEAGERRMIHSVFDLSDTTTREVLVPRDDVVYIERHKNLKQTLSLFLRSGFSRLPVIGEDLDDVLGFVYLKDVVERDFHHPEEEFVVRVEEVMRPAHFVPDSKPVDALLSEMQSIRQHIAVVVDEYGGVAGLVTIEDVLEEIVGEITDEYDPDEDEVEELEPGVVRVPAKYPVDDLDELFGESVEEEDVDSVGGLLTKHLGRVPIPGAHVEAHGLRFEAERAGGRRNRLETVLISRVGEAEDAAGSGARSAGRPAGGRNGDHD